MVSQHEIRCNILTGGEGAQEEGGGKLGIEKDSLKVELRDNAGYL